MLSAGYITELLGPASFLATNQIYKKLRKYQQ